MGKNVRTRRWLVAGLAASLVVAACSGDGGASPSTSAAGDAGGSAAVASGGEQGALIDIAGLASPDPSDASFVDNLLAREADGEWSRGEGLVATLQLALGDGDAAEVLRAGEVADRELTGVVAMARQFLADSPDDPATGEIQALLDRLVFSSERLAAMAGVGPTTASVDDAVAIAALQTAEQDCLAFFPKEAATIQGGVGQCLQAREVVVFDTESEGPFIIYAPAPELGSGGWEEKHYQLAAEAMAESIPVLAELQMREKPFVFPPVNLVFSVTDGVGSALADPATGKPCGVVMFAELLKPIYSDADFKQIVAHELGHCYQTERFPDQNAVPLEFTRWREEGMAQLLSNIVYPHNDLEWDPGRLSKLRKKEFKTSLFGRAYTNSIFFQYLLSTGSVDSLFNVIDSLPTSPGAQQQRDALAAYPAMLVTHHQYAETLTDEMILDSSGSFGVYEMTEENFPSVEVAGPSTVLSGNLERFQLVRANLTIPEGKQACFLWDDATFMVTKREHPRSEETVWEPLPPIYPTSLEDPREIAVVVTPRSDGAFALHVPFVEDFDEEHDAELVGSWVVVNASLARKVDYLAPVQTITSVTGRIVVTFRADGTVHLAYDGFTVAGSSDVRLEDGAFTSDFSSTYESVTDAEGTDTYELANDYVFFGELAESSFLEGSETVSETFSGLFFGVATDDIELETRLPESSVHERSPIGWAILGAASQIDFACGGEYLLIGDVVLRRAEG